MRRIEQICKKRASGRGTVFKQAGPCLGANRQANKQAQQSRADESRADLAYKGKHGERMSV